MKRIGRRRHHHRSLRWIVPLCAALLLASCTTRFFYEQLDWLIVWRIGGYVSLTGEQKESLKTDVHDHLEYVRVNEMPKAAVLVDRVARDIEAGNVTPDMLDAAYQDSLALFDEFMLGIVPVSERFLRSLNEEQVAEFFANLEELNQEMYEEYSGRTAEEREKNRNRSAIESTEDFTGRLSREQRQILKDGLASMEDASEQWIDYQREWQRRFRTLVETRPPENEYREELTRLFVYPRSFHTPEYRARVDNNRQIFYDMMTELNATLTDRQRTKAVGEADKWRDRLLRLAADD